MAGLNSLISDQGIKTTSMPSWYDAAQQNVVNRATNAVNTMPSLQNTVAGGAINTLSQENNPFQQAQNTLGQISSGAANPWITNPTTGQVTPNTNTAMGGLFQAQNQQLEQLMPQIQARPQASAIGSGQFGSLRGQTAVDKATADAQANLLTAQMQAALNNQTTGAQAAANLGTVANQGITAQTNVGQLQQSDPFAAAAALDKILGGLSVGNTVTNQTQYSPLAQATSLATGIQGGTAGLDALLKNLGVNSGLGNIFSNISDLFSGGTTAANDTMANVNMGILNPAAGATTSGTLGNLVDDYGFSLPQ